MSENGRWDLTRRLKGKGNLALDTVTFGTMAATEKLNGFTPHVILTLTFTSTSTCILLLVQNVRQQQLTTELSGPVPWYCTELLLGSDLWF